MKMSFDELDQEIAEIEARIAHERSALEDAVDACMSRMRDTVTSPKALFALLGVGYGIGRLIFGGGKAMATGPAPKAGMLGLLTGVAGTALSILQPRFGLGSIARWAAKRALASRKPAAPPATSRLSPRNVFQKPKS